MGLGWSSSSGFRTEEQISSFASQSVNGFLNLNRQTARQQCENHRCVSILCFESKVDFVMLVAKTAGTCNYRFVPALTRLNLTQRSSLFLEKKTLCPLPSALLSLPITAINFSNITTPHKAPAANPPRSSNSVSFCAYVQNLGLEVRICLES